MSHSAALKHLDQNVSEWEKSCLYIFTENEQNRF